MHCRFKILIFCLFIILSNTYNGHAQSSFFTSGGAHTLSLANTGTMFNGIESIYTNPAGLVSLDGYAFDVGYDRRFNLSELSTVSMAGAKKIGNNVIGISIARFGYSAYTESKAGLTYARLLSRKFSIGGSLNYLGFNIDQYGSSSKFTFDLGLQYKINDEVSLGAYVFSPGTISLTDDQDVPSRFSLGLKYKASKKADVYVDVSKTINRNPDFRFSVDYHLIDRFSLRAGANITQSSIHFGPAYHMENGIMITGGYSFDNRLGHSTGLSLSYVGK